MAHGPKGLWTSIFTREKAKGEPLMPRPHQGPTSLLIRATLSYLGVMVVLPLVVLVVEATGQGSSAVPREADRPVRLSP